MKKCVPGECDLLLNFRRPAVHPPNPKAVLPFRIKCGSDGCLEELFQVQPQPLDAKPSILLVDDHAHNLVALEAVIGSSDYNLITATSGVEALALLEVHDIAMILLDIHMPEMDGYEVARRIKASAKTKDIPLILITAIYREDPYIQKAYEVGAVDFFSKPFNPDLLRLKVKIYAELYQKNIVLHHQEEERRRMQSKVNELKQTLQDRESARLDEQERRAAELRTILESIPDAIYVGDEKGITRCNAKALAMFGFETCDELNEHFEKLAERIQMRDPKTRRPIPRDDQPFAHALRGDHYVSNLTIRHLTSGRDLTISCAAAPIVYQGKIIGAVVVNMDVPKTILFD